ncbi:MAG: hypothetical protein RL417_175 [Pseudomonadota bacterium]
MRTKSLVSPRFIFVLTGIAVILGLARVGKADLPSASNAVRRTITPVEDPSKKNAPTVEIFVTAWCPYCRDLERFLKSNRIEYTRYDVEHDSKGIALYQSLGGGGIPIIRLDGRKIIRGFDEEELKEALRIGASNPELVVSSLNVKNSRDLVER